MKRQCSVVIGANFGDEGKGLTTDWLAHQRPSLVVRFNGGAQAGHTVVTDRKRHVFHHFGSGTLAGADTYLSKYFIVNPILFHKEIKELGFKPNVFVSPECYVTTPYDIMINQAIENARGNGRHGSCGVGINETVERMFLFPLAVKDLFSKEYIKITLREIRDQHVPYRLKELNLPPFPSQYMSDNIIEKFAQDCLEMMDSIFVVNSPSRLDHGNIIFEGAQGLRLDERHKNFPHVTRSRTGFHNVRVLLKQFDMNECDVYYITRAYLTRHGAGPLKNEVPQPYPGILDETNVPHAFQGTIRYAHLDLDDLKEEIDNDLMNHSLVNIHKKLVVTCVDQVGENVTFINEGIEKTSSVQEFLSTIREKISPEEMIISTGPSRKDMYHHRLNRPELPSTSQKV